MLTIPDNEAETALATLRRLGVELGDLRRSDLYRVELDSDREDETIAALRGLETIFNPNKHALHVRSETTPRPGEVWIDDPSREATKAGAENHAAVRVGGVELPGVHQIERFTAWELIDTEGVPAPPELVKCATEALLCNPAFQRATLCG